MIEALDRFLGAGWRLVFDTPRNTVLILHRSGLWLEIDYDSARSQTDPRVSLAFVETLRSAVAMGLTGQHTLETRRHREYAEGEPGLPIERVELLLVRV